MKPVIFLAASLFLTNSFAQDIQFICGSEDQDRYELNIDSQRALVTVKKNNTVICTGSQYLMEGELFEYGSGQAIFYCAGKGYTYSNNFDEWILTIDGLRDSRGYREEFFCE